MLKYARPKTESNPLSYNYISNRNLLLKSIKEQAEKEILQFRAAQEAEYQRMYDMVRMIKTLYITLQLKEKIDTEAAGDG